MRMAYRERNLNHKLQVPETSLESERKTAVRRSLATEVVVECRVLEEVSSRLLQSAVSFRNFWPISSFWVLATVTSPSLRYQKEKSTSLEGTTAL